MGGTRPQKRSSARVDCRARREDVVDEDQPPAGNSRLVLFRHAKGSLDIVGPLNFGPPDLVGRGADALKAAMRDRHSGES